MTPLLVAYVVWVRLSRPSVFVAFSTHKDAFKLGGISKSEILWSWEFSIWYVLRKFPVCDKLLWQKEKGWGKGYLCSKIENAVCQGRKATVPGAWGSESPSHHAPTVRRQREMNDAAQLVLFFIQSETPAKGMVLATSMVALPSLVNSI